jgi:hypothetical protein
VVSQGIPHFLPISTVLHVIISKQDIHICQIFHNYLTITLPSVLKPKYSLSTRNKCVYLLEASETSITIWWALIHLEVLLLNNYEISGIYEYPVWR